MCDRSMRSGTELAWEIKLTNWSMAGNLSNWSSGVQIPCDNCTRLKRYLYSAKCSWIIKPLIALEEDAVHKIYQYVRDEPKSNLFINHLSLLSIMLFTKFTNIYLMKHPWLLVWLHRYVQHQTSHMPRIKVNQ